MTNVAISMLFRYDEKYKSHNTNGLNRNIGCIEIEMVGMLRSFVQVEP